MTRTEHLLWLLAEECAEVAQRASKAARFGLSEIEPGQTLPNSQRIMYELCDLFAVVDLLGEEGSIAGSPDSELVAAKRAKVEKFLLYSQECGTLTA
jgi:hypothetical protein